VEPDNITELDQALVTLEVIEPQMTRNNKSDWGNTTMDETDLG
jgi:hypothetical protein